LLLTLLNLSNAAAQTQDSEQAAGGP